MAMCTQQGQRVQRSTVHTRVNVPCGGVNAVAACGNVRNVTNRVVTPPPGALRVWVKWQLVVKGNGAGQCNAVGERQVCA